jgi:hypothetical protein
MREPDLERDLARRHRCAQQELPRPFDAFRNALSASWPVVLPLLTSAIDRISKRHWAADETTQSTLGPCIASARHLLSMSRDYGIDAALPEAIHRVFQRAVDAGHRDDDVASAYVGLR